MAAQRLVRRIDVAEAGAVEQHVVPGRRRAVAFLRRRRQVQVGDQPRRIVAGQRRAAQRAGNRGPDARQHEGRRRPDQPLRLDADGFAVAQHVDRDARLALVDAPDQRAGQQPPLGMTRQAAHQPRVAVGRSQHAVGRGVGRLAVAAREIVQPGPGRGLRGAGAVVVAARVVGQPAHRRCRVAVLVQPAGEGDAVERPPLRVGRRPCHGQREGAPAVAAARPLQFVHVFVEAALLPALAGIDGALRQQALFPQAVAEHPLLRRRAQQALVVHGPARRRVALQCAEFGEQFANQNRLRSGQGQVVGAPRVGGDRRGAGPRIAAGPGLHVDDQEVVHRGTGQPPRSRQAGNAGADDDDARAPGLGRRGESAVAQPVAERGVHAEQFARRQRGMGGRGAAGQRGRAGRAQKIPPASQTSAATG